jgi:hypothetical protein
MPAPQSTATPEEIPLPPVKLSWVGAVLSFVIPGLGQVYQGRISKGLLFFFGLYLLFFYGMWMGQWQNVWIPDERDLPDIVLGGQTLGGVPKALAYRPQYLGQFWIGIPAWPAIYQYARFDRMNKAGPIFGKFERQPSEDELNDLQRNASKRYDLGWVFTVIAGVLNLLVIYDALAGPMFRDPPHADAVDDARLNPPVEPAPPLPPVASAPAEGPPIANPTPSAPGGSTP